MRRPLLFCPILFYAASAHGQQMLKSLSGPSGHTSGPKFVFDETRSRFVYPQDKSLVVYFEWAAPRGLHTISAVWKSPDGRPSSIPADIKIDLGSGDLAAYWTFDISPADAPGIWTLETRVDGAPGGSHSFEIYLPPVPAQPAPAPTLPTRDDVYRAAVPSLVVVSSLDATGQHVDTSLGFVYAQDEVATAFQGIDGASMISVTFADGTSVRTDSLAGWNRAADWAIIPVPTGSRKALNRGSSSSAKVGERVLAFTLENGKTPVAAAVDVTGRTPNSIQLNPALPSIAAGSPVFSSTGDVIGILGAWTTPGSRVPSAVEAENRALWGMKESVDGLTPIEAVQAQVQPQKEPATLRHLIDAGIFTQALERFPSLMYATTTDVSTKRDALPDRNITEFPRQAATVWVVSMWARREKLKSALVSTSVFDLANHKRGESASKKVSFGDTPYRLTNSFVVSGLEPGSYRVDLNADGKVVWRSFIKIAE